ncbi:MAG: hypothetical protein ABIJ27_02605 [Candidatus Omnitrophota bacterium]
MQRRRNRRFWFRASLVFLLGMTSVFFLETYIQRIVPGFIPIVEDLLETVLDDRVSITIGSIEGGIFRNYEMKDVVVEDASGTFPPTTIESVSINYGLIGVFLNRKKEIRKFFRSLEQPFIDITIDNTKGIFKGYVRIEGDAREIRFQGFRQPNKKENIAFKGRCGPMTDLGHSSFDLDATMLGGSMNARGTIDEREISATVAMNHLNVAGADILGELTVNGSLPDEGVDGKTVIKSFCESRIYFGRSDIICNANVVSAAWVDRLHRRIETKGTFSTVSLIVNQRPFRDIRFDFDISMPINPTDDAGRYTEVRINDLRIGKEMRSRVSIDMKKPDYPTSAVFVVDNLNITQLLLDFKVRMPDLEKISGIANARFELEGPLKNLSSSGRLDIRKGNLGELIFDSMHLSLRGNGPVLDIVDSRINMREGHMVMRGEMDLRNLDTDIMKNVEFVIDNEAIIWEGWNIVKKNSGDYKIRATKPINEKMSLHFQTFANDENDMILDDREGGLELEYKLFSKESLKMRMGAEQEYLGLEHTEKF